MGINEQTTQQERYIIYSHYSNASLHPLQVWRIDLMQELVQVLLSKEFE